MDPSGNDPFYNDQIQSRPPGVVPAFVSNGWRYIISVPEGLLYAVILAFVSIIVATRLLSEHVSEKVEGKDARTVWLLPYSIPLIGHTWSLFVKPDDLLSKARDFSPHGIFALNLGATKFNIISDPALVEDVLQKPEHVVQFRPIAWNALQRFFGVPNRSKAKHVIAWDDLDATWDCLKQDQGLENVLKPMVQSLQRNIPQMLTFTDADIDMQPWERSSNANYVSDSETEVDLEALMSDMMGHASIPAILGHAFMEKYPDSLRDILEVNEAIDFFSLGLPSWLSWPNDVKSRLALFRVLEYLDDHQKALDATAEDKPVDPSWGELDDVSELCMRRNELYRQHGLDIKERSEICVLWALVANANLLVYWQILYILSTPGLAERIRAEIAPYVSVAKPFAIGSISEPPKMTLLQEELATRCPLLKSTYREALRLTDKSWSVRKIASAVTISGDENSEDPASYLLREGEYVVVPHDLHSKNSRYFVSPETFDPERFLTRESSLLSTEMGSTLPFGGGPSMCKGNAFVERECLSLVAGMLVFWDIKPVDKKGWVVPEQRKTSAISRPIGETRVRIRRQKFEWET